MKNFAMKKIARIAALLSAALFMAAVATGAGATTGGQVSLDDTFSPNRETYSATVAHHVTSVTVTASPQDPKATVTVNGKDPSTPVPLAVGVNTITVVVTAPDARYTRTYTVTVTREAAPEPEPAVAVTLAATPNPVAEGSPVTVTATLAKALAEDVTIPLAVTGGTSEDGDHGTLASVTVPAGGTSATGTITTGNDTDGDDETFTVALGSLPSGLAAGTESSVEVTITDDGAQPQQATAPLTAAFEGVPDEHDGKAAFSLDVRFSEALGEGGKAPTAASFAVTGGKAKRVERVEAGLWRVRVKPGSWREVTVTLAASSDCAANGAVCASGGRALSNASSATIGSPVRIRVADGKAREGRDESLDFAVTLNRAAEHEVSVDYATRDGTATAGADYTAASGTLVFAAGETAKTVSVAILDDAVDEGKETFRLRLSNPQGAYLRGIHREAKGTIRNDDPMPGAWLSRFGRSVAGHHVAAIRDRLAADSGPGLSGRFAGQPLPQAQDGVARADGLDDTSPETRVARHASTAGAVLSSRTADALADAGAGGASVLTVAADDVLLGTEVVMTRDAGSGLSHGFWGRAARSGVSGREDGTSVEGTVTSVLLGTDWKRKGMAFGVVVSESRGAMTYGGASSGAIDARLSALVPWAGLEIGKHSSLWGAAGIGRGDMTLRPEGRDPTVTGIGWSMAALGAKGALAPGARVGGASLGWHADALATRTRSDAVRTGTGNLAATSAETTRMRLGLSAAWERALANGATLSHRLEAGVRHDGGDAETGLGIEVGGGIAFADPARGLSMSMDARTLAMHEDGNFRDWGLSLGFSWDPRPETKRGCSATAMHGLGGASAGGVNALFGPEAFPGVPGAQGGSGWSVEAACGTGRGRGMVGSPYARASGGEADSLRVGYRIEPDADHAEDATVQAWADPSADGGSVGAGLEWRW